MLQRSPTYVASVPGDDYALDWLAGKFSPLSKTQAYKLLRARNVLMQQGTYRAAVFAPKVIKALLKRSVKTELKGSGVDIAHFMPTYNPWDERLCAVPDSDLFKALHGKHAAVVTDQISHFTKTGIMLDSGKHLDADIVVTATGLKLQMLGGAKLYIDGQAIDIGKRMTYKAVMIVSMCCACSTICTSTVIRWQCHTQKLRIARRIRSQIRSWARYRQATCSARNTNYRNKAIFILGESPIII